MNEARIACADFGSMPIMMLAIQIWAFWAFTSVADGIADLSPGADGGGSAQSR